MFPRSNSPLSKSPLADATARFVRKHSRASIVASTAVAAGAFGVIGATAASASTGPNTPFAGNVGRSVQAGASQLQSQQPSIIDQVIGMRAHTGEPPQEPTAAQLDFRLLANAVANAPQPAVTATATAATTTTSHAAAPAPATGSHAPAPAPASHQPAPAPAPKTPAAQQPAVQHPAPAKPKPRPKPAPARAQAPVGPTKPYQIYDSVSPSAIPGGKRVAVYANGSYFASASAVSGRSHVLWIDTNGSDPNANALDVEPGDATPAGAAQWVHARLRAHPHQVAIVYTMLSQWQAVKDNVAGLPAWMQAKVRYWIADPTGYNHVVPGASATQWYWGQNYDITTANPNFEH